MPSHGTLAAGERIVCAALWVKTAEISSAAVPYGFVVAGVRHGDCFAVVARLDTSDVRSAEQGFLAVDASGAQRFVGRREALEIAQRAGQLQGRDKHRPRHLLLSEDLY